MKGLKWLMLIVIALLMMNTAAMADTDYIHVTGDSNVRSGPSLDNKTLGSVKKGSNLDYAFDNAYDDRGVEWYKIYYSGGTAWISSKYSEMVDGSGSRGGRTVQALGDVTVRTRPNLEAGSLGTLKKGSYADYLGESATDDRGVRWYMIDYKGDEGWVSGRYAELLDDGDSGGDYGYSYVYATGNVSVRAKPNLNGSYIGTLLEGDTAEYMSEKSVDDRGVTWYQIEYKGKMGWVSSKYAELDGNRGDAAVGYVKATGDVTVRSHPRLSGSFVGTLKKGNSATYLDESDIDDRGVEWYRIEFKGQKGWVSSRYTELFY